MQEDREKAQNNEQDWIAGIRAKMQADSGEKPPLGSIFELKTEDLQQESRERAYS